MNSLEALTPILARTVLDKLNINDFLGPLRTELAGKSPPDIGETGGTRPLLTWTMASRATHWCEHIHGHLDKILEAT